MRKTCNIKRKRKGMEGITKDSCLPSSCCVCCLKYKDRHLIRSRLSSVVSDTSTSGLSSSRSSSPFFSLLKAWNEDHVAVLSQKQFLAILSPSFLSDSVSLSLMCIFVEVIHNHLLRKRRESERQKRRREKRRSDGRVCVSLPQKLIDFPAVVVCALPFLVTDLVTEREEERRSNTRRVKGKKKKKMTMTMTTTRKKEQEDE